MNTAEPTCAHCNGVIPLTNKHRARAKFCNRNCMIAYRQAGRTYDGVCPVCGKGFQSYHLSQPSKYCSRACMVESFKKAYTPEEVAAYAYDHIEKDDVTGCWNWTGSRVPDGYGVMPIGKRPDGKKKYSVVHRWTYEQLVGPIPEGLQLDHLCRNTSCVNPAHLEPVTCQVNLIRGVRRNQYKDRTHCSRGHEYTPENTQINKRGTRICRTCKREDCRKVAEARSRAVVLAELCAAKAAAERRRAA